MGMPPQPAVSGRRTFWVQLAATLLLGFGTSGAVWGLLAANMRYVGLFAVVMAAQQGQWAELRAMVKRLQAGALRMRYASVPVVAAPFGMTLGGGLEVCFGANHVQAAAETYAGLVEVGVGIIPGGAGNLHMLWRAFEALPEGAKVDPSTIVTQVFMNIALAKVTTSADEAKAFGYFRSTDGVSFDRARQKLVLRQFHA